VGYNILGFTLASCYVLVTGLRAISSSVWARRLRVFEDVAYRWRIFQETGIMPLTHGNASCIIHLWGDFFP
jgi:hypothetical protein